MLIIIIYILHFQGYVVWSKKSEWKAEIPSSVVALENSCVVVSCTYEHPNTQTDTLRRPFWYISTTKGKKEIEKKMVYSEVPTTKIEERFQSRTSMPGNINEKNCSLQIDNVKQDDPVGPYVFRIVMPQFNNYSFRQFPARITVKAEPDHPSLLQVKKEVSSGENVTVSCSASHSCPPHPPAITWSRDGKVTIQSEPLTGGQHKLSSFLSFKPNTDHPINITCFVQHHGGKKSYNSINITVGNSASIPDGRDVNDNKNNVVHTTRAPVTVDKDSVSTYAPEDDETTTQFSTIASPGQGPLIIAISVGVPLLIIAIAMLVGFILYRKHKRKQNTQPNLYADKIRTGDRPCLEMSDEVYANTEVITAGKDVGDDDEDIYANTEFLESKNPAIWMNHGLGSATEPDEDIYANM